MLAWVALTSDDLPMPRAPHNRALLAGSPSAKRSVFSIRMSRIRSIPLSRPRSTRLTRGTAASRPSGCQTKASAEANDSGPRGAGEAAERLLAMASSALAIRSAVALVIRAVALAIGAVSPLDWLAGRFVAVFAGFRGAALVAARGPVFLAFFDICGVPDGAALSGLGRSRKRPK